LKYDVTYGASFKFTFGYDFERKRSRSVRILEGTIFDINLQAKKNFSEDDKAYFKSTTAFSTSYCVFSREREAVVEKDKLAAVNVEVNAGADVSSNAGGRQSIQAAGECCLTGGMNLTLKALGGVASIVGPLVKIA
jgi:hypothetical protein